jgi:hypothetical protein
LKWRRGFHHRKGLSNKITIGDESCIFYLAWVPEVNI